MKKKRTLFASLPPSLPPMSSAPILPPGKKLVRERSESDDGVSSDASKKVKANPSPFLIPFLLTFKHVRAGEIAKESLHVDQDDTDLFMGLGGPVRNLANRVYFTLSSSGNILLLPITQVWKRLDLDSRKRICLYADNHIDPYDANAPALLEKWIDNNEVNGEEAMTDTPLAAFFLGLQVPMKSRKYPQSSNVSTFLSEPNYRLWCEDWGVPSWAQTLEQKDEYIYQRQDALLACLCQQLKNTDKFEVRSTNHLLELFHQRKVRDAIKSMYAARVGVNEFETAYTSTLVNVDFDIS